MAVLAAHKDHRGAPSWFAGDARDVGGRLGSLGFAWERRRRGEAEERERVRVSVSLRPDLAPLSNFLPPLLGLKLFNRWVPLVPLVRRTLNLNRYYDLLTTIRSQIRQGSIFINLETNSKVNNLLALEKQLNKSNND